MFLPTWNAYKIGRYAQSITYLAESNSSIGKDHPVKNPKTFNRTIDVSKVQQDIPVIDGDHSGYNDVVNRFNAMDAQLGDYNNDVLDISSF